MERKSWKDFVVNFGKHSGKTMFQIYYCDFDYCVWLAENMKNEHIRDAAKAAVEHKAKADPYAWSIN